MSANSDPPRDDQEAVLAREKERFGGMKFGSAFFGWLAATGMLILLTVLAAAIAAVIGNAVGGVNQVADQVQSMSTQNLQNASIWGGVVLLVIWFIAYYCGGYVAGRMARFNGVKQGVAVWLWAVVIAVILAIIGLIVGQNVLTNISGLPNIPIDPGQLTVVGVISIIAVLVVALIGAILGGLAGMRYHRKVDRAGFGEE